MYVLGKSRSRMAWPQTGSLTTRSAGGNHHSAAMPQPREVLLGNSTFFIHMRDFWLSNNIWPGACACGISHRAESCAWNLPQARRGAICVPTCRADIVTEGPREVHGRFQFARCFRHLCAMHCACQCM